MKRLLLDTHVVIWWLSNSVGVGTDARAVIAGQSNEVFVSAVVGLEIAGKRALAKLRTSDSPAELVERRGFTVRRHCAQPSCSCKRRVRSSGCWLGQLTHLGRSVAS